MNINLDMRTVQSASPRMIASMAMLQRSAQELTEYLESLSCENPMLELEEPEPAADLPENPIWDRLQWLKSADRQNRSYYADNDQASIDQYAHIARECTLQDFLEEQMLTLHVSAPVRSAMQTITGLLDDRGLFTGSVQLVADLTGCTPDEAEEALAAVRTLEPAGVAAESVRQCLILQAERLDKPLLQRLLTEQYQHLGTWSDQRIARAMGAPEASVRAAKAALAELNPRPANGFAGADATIYVRPDLTILPVDGVLQAVAEENLLPAVHISADYLRMLKTVEDPETVSWLKAKLRQAEEVMEDLSRRKSTILRCGEVIARCQQAFFSGGALVKLTMRDVAEELGLHESTISRTIRNKYIQCSRGILPMSAFFSRDVGQNVGLSRSGVQEILCEIIRSEDPAHPLSDEKIAARLADRRITLSRRAVAKYRLESGIPPASARKHQALCQQSRAAI